MGIGKTDKQEREQQIFEAAYSVLAQKGYKGASMLAIAKAASASNETMYSWYKNKQGLLAAMIENNASPAEVLLNKAILSNEPVAITFSKIGPIILKLTTSKRAVILNRAAAADVADGGRLGKLIAERGRNKITPLLEKIFARAIEQGLIKADDPKEICEIYISLILGDSQIRRVIGVANELDEAVIDNHCERCIEIIFELYGS